MAAIQTLIRDGVSRRYSEVVAASGSSEAVVIDSHVNTSITVKPGAGGATVHFTNSTEDEILADTADWEAWSFGSVTELTTKILAAAMAVKLVNDDGVNVSKITVVVTT